MAVLKELAQNLHDEFTNEMQVTLWDVEVT
jgi:hypothetical protein